MCYICVYKSLKYMDTDNKVYSFNMYEDAIKFAEKMVFFKKSKALGMDIVHDAIAEGNINDSNFKKIITEFFYKEKRYEYAHVKYTGLEHIYKNEITNLPCKYCMQELPIDCFRVITDKYGLSKYFTTSCKDCEHIGARDRIRRFNKKQCLNIGDYYVKKCISNRSIISMKDIKEVDIEIKRTEILLNRVSKSFNHKRYGRYRRKKN